jgi:hypothetical protein
MRVNRATGHCGAVFAERYFVRQLHTATEVARAVAYVPGNERQHGFEQREPLILAKPETWLLRRGGCSRDCDRARLRYRTVWRTQCADHLGSPGALCARSARINLAGIGVRCA